jgi:hypothetical protein
LIVIGTVLWVLCVATAILSNEFAWGSNHSFRPIRTFVCLMLVMFVLYLVALRIAIRLKSHPDIGKWILWFGLGFRLVLLPSHPILQIDICRYMWDGRVVAECETPFQYSPRDVLASSTETGDIRLRSLVKLRDRSIVTQTVLSRIHFEHLTTIYPPVSQSVSQSAGLCSGGHCCPGIDITVDSAVDDQAVHRIVRCAHDAGNDAAVEAFS